MTKQHFFMIHMSMILNQVTEPVTCALHTSDVWTVGSICCAPTWDLSAVPACQLGKRCTTNWEAACPALVQHAINWALWPCILKDEIDILVSPWHLHTCLFSPLSFFLTTAKGSLAQNTCPGANFWNELILPRVQDPCALWATGRDIQDWAGLP